MTTSKNRIYSLDMLRGILVAAIFFFDTPLEDTMYPLIRHIDWEGFSIAEVGVPLFAFMMGASMAISFSRRTPSIKKIFIRTTIIFALGVFLENLQPLYSLLLVENFSAQNFFDSAIAHGRLFGVLQRLAITYVFAVVLVRAIKKDAGIFIAAFVLLAISSAGFHIYAPDNPFSPDENISRAVDYIFPGVNHIYSTTHDPEGLYGAIGGTASVLLGYIAGRVLIDTSTINQKIFLISAAGIAFLIVAGLWSFADIVSKRLWTAPYALINAGMDYLSLALCMNAFDKSPPQKRFCYQLIALGRNPLVFYFMNFAVALFLLTLPVGDTNAYMWLYAHTTQGIVSPEFGTLLFCIMWTALWFPVAEIFRRLNIIIKI